MEELDNLDQLEIEEQLLQIQNIHESFDEKNPLTYSIMLNTNRDRLNEGQIRYLEMMINKFTQRQHKLQDRWRSYMTRGVVKEEETDSLTIDKREPV